MREVLYKAITNDRAHVWVKGILLPNTAQITVEVPDPNYPGNYFNNYYQVCVETASQLICRKENEKELYTNDIFIYEDEKYVVDWPEGKINAVAIRESDNSIVSLDNFNLEDIEVIGNIYDDYVPPTLGDDGVEKGG